MGKRIKKIKPGKIAIFKSKEKVTADLKDIEYSTDSPIKAKQHIKNMFQKIQEEEKKYPIRCWIRRKIYRFLRLPTEIRLRIIMFVQRGIKGWSYPDTWDFDGYLTDVIIGGITHLRKYTHGHPCEVNNLKIWKKTLQKIINGFKAYKRACDYTKTKTEQKHRKEMKEFYEGMRLFTKYYGNLWD